MNRGTVCIQKSRKPDGDGRYLLLFNGISDSIIQLARLYDSEYGRRAKCRVRT